MVFLPFDPDLGYYCNLFGLGLQHRRWGMESRTKRMVAVDLALPLACNRPSAYNGRLFGFRIGMIFSNLPGRGPFCACLNSVVNER